MSISRQSPRRFCYTFPAWLSPASSADRRRSGPEMPEVLGAILLIVGIILAAVLAIAVTRWALHMNEE